MSAPAAAAAAAAAPAKTSRLLQTTSVLNLLVNIVTMGVLIGVVVLLGRVNSTLDKIGKMQVEVANGVQTVEISQTGYGMKAVDVRLVNNEGRVMGTSSFNGVYVRGSS